MIILGVALVVVGVLLHIWILYVVGIVALVLGVCLLVASHFGHPVGGRRFWY